MDIAKDVHLGVRPAIESIGAQPGDPWYARLAFHLLQKVGPGWLTLWLILIMGGLIALGVVGGPWVPGVIAATGVLTAGGAAVAKKIGAKPADSASTPALPAVDSPP